MISNDIKQQIIELRKQGKTYPQIHELTGVAKSSISDICRPLGLGGNKVILLTTELIRKAQELYDEIGSIKEVGKKLGVSYDRLNKVVILKRPSNITKSEAVIRWRNRVKTKLVEYKGGKCQCCGYNRCIRALEFHHLDPSQKDFTISGKSKSFEMLKKEADKCILVCSNCHKEIHAGIRKIEDEEIYLY